jgi:aminomethyltransferase
MPGLLRTPLYELHRSLGAKFVEFAGYEMPVQFPEGIIAEHRHTRTKVSLFDVSHMGQVAIGQSGAAKLLERLVPSDVVGLAPGQVRYSVLLNAAGGIIDDITVGNAGDALFLVVNAARKANDVDLLKSHFVRGVTLREDFALLAIQGPSAAAILKIHTPGVEKLSFMNAAPFVIGKAACLITRSGYTGEDGFEISVAADDAMSVANLLLQHPDAKPAGLGARDSLRLEAGLCLYGHDIDERTTPIEAGLAWIIPKRRRAEGGFPGTAVIDLQLRAGTTRTRVGIRPQGRVIARAETPIFDQGGTEIGVVTSGGFSPTLDGPIAMGYVPARAATPGTEVGLDVRGTVHTARIVSLPFVPHRYHRG